MNFKDLTWTCHVCGETREDAKISVHKTDLSEEFGLSPWSMSQNVRFCNDREACIKSAPSVRFVRDQVVIGGHPGSCGMIWDAERGGWHRPWEPGSFTKPEDAPAHWREYQP